MASNILQTKKLQREYLIAERKAREELTEKYVQEEDIRWEEDIKHNRWRGCD